MLNLCTPSHPSSSSSGLSTSLRPKLIIAGFVDAISLALVFIDSASRPCKVSMDDSGDGDDLVGSCCDSRGE